MKRFAYVLGTFLAGLGASADDATLESRVQALERSLGNSGTGGAGEPATAFWKDGLRFDLGSHLNVRLGGHVIAHGTWNNHGDAVFHDTFSIKEAQVVGEGSLDDRWIVHVAAEARPGQSGLYEGWVEFNGWDWIRLRAGLFKVPYSREALEPTEWQDFPENSFAELHAPGRDLGLMAHSVLLQGVVDYAFGVFNGNGPSGLDSNSDKDVAGYVGISPFAWLKSDFLRNLRLGISGTSGRHEGRADDLPLQPDVPSSGSEIQTNRAGKSPGFATVSEKGRRRRASADLALGLGPVELNTQISRFVTGLDSSGSRSEYRSWANRWSIGLWIGGKRDAGHRPVVDHALMDGGIGAFQFVVRYSTATLDDDFIKRSGFAGTDHVREYAAAVNWYPNAFVRVTVMVSDVRYSRQGIPVGDASPPPAGAGNPVGGNDRFAHHLDDEKVLLVRLQVDF